jgi:Mce-associated membrane protein
VTAVLDTTHATTPDEPSPNVVLASWRARAGAFAIDVLPGLAVIATTAILALTAPSDSWQRWMVTAALGVTVCLVVANRLLLPIATGWTLGRALFGIAVRRRDGEAPGALRLAAREAAHLLDTVALCVGWLWPLWDRRRRTFADLLVRTEVRRVEAPRRNIRRVVAKVLIATAVVCVAAAGLGYATVYRHERAVDMARQQVAQDGPRIVEQMLSYRVDTMPEDFARAQSLTTDGYRGQLIAQQQAVQQAGATTNEYWTVNAAVLTDPPITADRVSMLLAMQGQRGSDPQDLKFITATVQVEFEKASDGQWRVDNLTVLKKPMMSQAAR